MLRPKSRNPRAAGDVVDLLLECHERIRKFCALARSAGEARDAPAEQVVDACAAVERYFTEALPLHVRDEEDSILPRLAGRSPDLDRALETMRDEHGTHQPELAAMLSACAALRMEPLAAPLREALAQAASELERSFERHLQLEEAVIFPAIRAELKPELEAEILKELRARRAPRS